MDFYLNEFLISVSNTLDAIEIDLFGIPTNHSKRIAYIASRIGLMIKMKPEEIFDLSALSLMHDNGATMKILGDQMKLTLKEKIILLESRKEHCIIGERNIAKFPFKTKPKDVIRYHHERYDGNGFFGIVADDIPLFSQIIFLADSLDLNFEINEADRKEMIDFIRARRCQDFSPAIADVFIRLAQEDEFWDALHDERIDASLKKVVPVFSDNLGYREIRAITETLSRIIDAKSFFTRSHSSGLSIRMNKMIQHYAFDQALSYKTLIATDLHDIGKLAVSNEILDKPDTLTDDEFEQVKIHPAVTKQCLQAIHGFEEIANWASNHHEKLDGSGYPRGLKGEHLDFISRLIACMDIYQALREVRPYRKSMNHDNAMSILYKMVIQGKLDRKIVTDIDLVFAPA